MITLGYIVKLNSTTNNLAEVRIPIFEKPGFTNTSVLQANICYNPGNLNGYLVGDCVVVGFLDNKMTEPVILGKLYVGPEDKATNYSFVNSLTVTEKAELPSSTKIGTMDVMELLNLNNRLQSKISELEARLNKIE